jgi:hypothetical protein
MWALCWRWRIPKKTDDAGWRELTKKVSEDTDSHVSFMRYLKQKLLHLEYKIQILGSQKTSLSRTKKIKELKNQHSRIRKSLKILEAELKQSPQN